MSFKRGQVNAGKLWTLIGTLCLITILDGCSRRVTDFTIISTKNTLLAGHGEKMERRIEGEDCKFTLLGLPDMKTAIDDAVENAGPEYDALVDGVVWYDDRFIYVCYRVEGTPIRAKENPLSGDQDYQPSGAPRSSPGLQLPVRPKQSLQLQNGEQHSTTEQKGAVRVSLRNSLSTDSGVVFVPRR